MRTEEWGGAKIFGRPSRTGIWNPAGLFKTIDFVTRHTPEDVLSEGFFDLYAHEVELLDRIRFHCWAEGSGTWSIGTVVVTGNTHGKVPGGQGRVTVMPEATPAPVPGGETMTIHTGFGKYDVVRGEVVARDLTKEQAEAMAGGPGDADRP